MNPITHLAAPTVRRVRLLLVLSTLLASGTMTLSSQTAWAQAGQTLDPGAKIHVTVAGEPDISGDYSVDTSGAIQMLYVNSVPVGGLTPAQAAAKLASNQFLGKYYRSPQVVVTLVNPGGIGLEVTGAVTKQGQLLVRPDTRLNDVVQQAGPAVDADLTRIQVTHGTPGTAHTTDTVDYLSFLNSQNPAGNPGLRDGDVIFLPRKEAVQIMVNLRGEVAKPGAVSVPAKTTVYDAIQSAGGLLPDADHKAIMVQHAGAAAPIPLDFETATRQQTDPQANPVLQDGDTVIVKAAAISNVYTITGAVQKPGEYPLPNPNFTLADAIGKAGGTAERPKLKEVTIVRRLPTGQIKALKMDASDFSVQGNTLVQPGDNISIPQGSAPHHFDPLQSLGVLGGLFGIFVRH